MHTRGMRGFRPDQNVAIRRRLPFGFGDGVIIDPASPLQQDALFTQHDLIEVPSLKEYHTLVYSVEYSTARFERPHDPFCVQMVNHRQRF